MSRKLLPADFIDIIAQNQGITKKKSEAFVRAFFEVIEEGLRNDSFVKIKGFGTFKLVSVSERESVNINTGERFQISGHTKVSFLPDSSFKELINRPFNHFETIVIPDSTTLEEIETISEGSSEEQDETDIIAPPLEETSQPSPVPEAEVAPSPVEEPALASAPLQEAPQEEVKPAVQETPKVEVNQEFPGEPQETEEPTPSTEAPEQLNEAEAIEEVTEVEEVEETEATEVIDENEVVIDMSSLVPQTSELESTTTEENAPAEEATDATNDSTPEATPAEEEELNPEAPAEEAEIQTENAETPANEADAIHDNSIPNTPSEDNEMSTPNTTKNSRWLFIGFVWILTLVISYLAGYHRLIPLEANPNNDQEISQNDSLQQATTDSLSAPADSVAPVNPRSLLPAGSDSLPVIRGVDKATAEKLSEEYSQVTPGCFLIIGTYGTHTLRKGDSLFKIARSTYGHRDYAKYIIHYNNFTYPYKVPLGTEILLPQLVEKEECADSTKVVKKKTFRKATTTTPATTPSTTEKSESVSTPPATTESPVATEVKTEN